MVFSFLFLLLPFFGAGGCCGGAVESVCVCFPVCVPTQGAGAPVPDKFSPADTVLQVINRFLELSVSSSPSTHSVIGFFPSCTQNLSALLVCGLLQWVFLMLDIVVSTGVEAVVCERNGQVLWGGVVAGFGGPVCQHLLQCHQWL
jgi:hypothetical protein